MGSSTIRKTGRRTASAAASPQADDPDSRGDSLTGEQHARRLPIRTTDLVRIGFVALAALASWLQVWKGLFGFDVIALSATLIGGYPIFRVALRNLWSRRMTMELSMTIAIVAAMVIGEFFTATVIILFVLVAELLEDLTVDRGRRAIQDLLDFLPRTTTVRRPEGLVSVQVDELQPGDVVLIKPGERIPVDGAVVGGQSAVDQSSITGESMPVEKGVSSHVYAGTVNHSGLLEVRASQIGRDTAFGKIVEAVERAEQSRAPIQKTADQLAGYLVYFALLCAAFTYFVTRDPRSTISVIIVAGACGIAAGTPLAILAGIGRAARQGAIVKGGLYMEVLGRIDTVVLDKTGTLTLGSPVVRAVEPVAGLGEAEVVGAAAIVERHSEHPLAKAVLRKASEFALELSEPDAFEIAPGKGVIGTSGGEQILVGSRDFLVEHGFDLAKLDGRSSLGSHAYVARGGTLLGSLRIEDILRPESVEAVAALRRMGLRTVLLTGDAEPIAASIGRELGIDQVEAEMLPEEKSTRINALLDRGKTVAMVGDGVNDAPALMKASVGIAMGSGTDVARESADVLLIGNDLAKLVDTLMIARRCRRIIMQNFTGTLVVDGLGVLLAAFGLLNPMLAAFIHVGSELAFIANSARLLPAPIKRKAET